MVSHTQRTIRLIDAGIDFNLPYPPLLRKARKVDLILAIDASSNTDLMRRFNTKAVNYARTRANCPTFPPLDAIHPGDKILDMVSGTPTILYLPIMHNPAYSTFDPMENHRRFGYCFTGNFRLTEPQFDELSGLAHFSLLQSRDTIMHALRQQLDTKKKTTAVKDSK